MSDWVRRSRILVIWVAHLRIVLAAAADATRRQGDANLLESLFRPTTASHACRYLAVWVAIKARWGLSMDSVEKRAISSFSACRSTVVPG